MQVDTATREAGRTRERDGRWTRDQCSPAGARRCNVPEWAKLRGRLAEALRSQPWEFAEQTAQSLGLSVPDLAHFCSALRQDPRAQLRPLDGPQRFFSDVLRQTLANENLLASVLQGAPPRPEILEVHAGLACHCRCVFCYSMGECLREDERGYRVSDRCGVLDASTWIRTIKAFRTGGGKSLIFSGGLEPLTCPFLPDLARTAVEVGLPVVLLTNGLPTLPENTWRWLVEHLACVRFSVHAATAATYHRTQLPHRSPEAATCLFERVKARIRAAVQWRDSLRSAGRRAAEIGVAFLSVKHNLSELPDAVRLWQEVGVDFVDLRNDALAENPRGGTLAPDDVKRRRQLEDELPRTQGSTRLSCHRHPDRDEDRFERPDRCFAPLAKVAVDPWGRVFTCCMRAHPALAAEDFVLAQLTPDAPDLYAALRGCRLPLPWHCAGCPDWEVALNRCCAKVKRDAEAGLPPRSQPVLQLTECA